MPAATPELDALADKLMLPKVEYSRSAIRSRHDLLEAWVMTAIGGMNNVTLKTYLDGFHMATGTQIEKVEDVKTIVESVLRYRFSELRTPEFRQIFIDDYYKWAQTHLQRPEDIPPLQIPEYKESSMIRKERTVAPSDTQPSPSVLRFSGPSGATPQSLSAPESVVTDTRMPTGPEKRPRESDDLTTETKSQTLEATEAEATSTTILPTTPALSATTGTVGGNTTQPAVMPTNDEWLGPVRRRNNRQGAWTGATRPTYPKVFRPFGTNTRERVVGNRSFTGMHHLGYATEIVESRPSPPLIPPTAALGQSGAPSVLRDIPALRRGSHHWLFGGGGSSYP